MPLPLGDRAILSATFSFDLHSSGDLFATCDLMWWRLTGTEKCHRVRCVGAATEISLRTFHKSHVGRAAMQRGTIKKLVADKGFGFIASGERGKDLFFHVSAVKDVAFDALFEGQSVDYEMEAGPKGDRASVVIPV